MSKQGKTASSPDASRASPPNPPSPKPGCAALILQHAATGSYGRVARNRLHKPDSLAELESAWKGGAGGYVPPLSAKQRGQLRRLHAACPPDSALQVMRAALGDWLGFAASVQSATGTGKVPAQPNLGFLVMHAGIAVDRHLAKSKPKPKPSHAAAKQGLQLTAKGSYKGPQGSEDKASLAETMAILGGEE